MKKTTIVALLAAVALVLYLLYTKGLIFANFESVTPQQAFEILRKDPEAVLLDVRTPQEYAQGHIEGAKLVPLQVLEERLKSLEPLKKKRLVVYCRSGHRSAAASRILADHGFKPLNVKGGINRWEAEGLPVVR